MCSISLSGWDAVLLAADGLVLQLVHPSKAWLASYPAVARRES